MAKRACVLAGIFALASALVLVGILKGDPGQVLTKAVTICLECVGIG